MLARKRKRGRPPGARLEMRLMDKPERCTFQSFGTREVSCVGFLHRDDFHGWSCRMLQCRVTASVAAADVV